jgi:hypothetical protein
MLDHAENARLLYQEHLLRLRAMLRAGARVEGDILLNRTALSADTTPLAIDPREFGPEWTAKMRVLLQFDAGGRAQRLKTWWSMLDAFERSADLAAEANRRDMRDARSFAKTARYLDCVMHLRLGIWWLRTAGIMYKLHVPTAAGAAARALEYLKPSLQALVRPPAAAVIPIR